MGPRPAAVRYLVAIGALALTLSCAPSSSSVTVSATTGPASTPLGTAAPSLRPSPSPALVLGGQDCVPSSPRIPSSGGIIGTVVGTTTGDAQLFALMHPLIQAGTEVKIVVRMTGRGPLETYAEHMDGTRVVPRLVEPHTLSSSFEAPGDEWGIFYTVPKAGCWQMHFTRTSGAGDIWFIAVPRP